MTGRQWTLRIKAPVPWLNVNQRRDRRAQAGDVKEWRKAGRTFCQQARVPRLAQAELTAVVRFPDDRVRRDAPNVYPSIKAAVDGVVDAGVVADDNDSYITALHILPGDPIPARPYGPAGELLLTIREVVADA
jgi:crossover junction endodeoxyribonuclease RusA